MSIKIHTCLIFFSTTSRKSRHQTILWLSPIAMFIVTGISQQGERLYLQVNLSVLFNDSQGAIQNLYIIGKCCLRAKVNKMISQKLKKKNTKSLI